MSNAIQPFIGSNRAQPVVPSTFDSVLEFSRLIFHSGMAPTGIQSQEQIAVAIFHGLEIGMTPLAALQSIAVINGRPSIWGDGAIGLVRGSGLCEYIKEWSEGDGDHEVAYCETKRKNGEVIKRKFSHADAKAANLLDKKGPWKEYRSRMMQMRARAWCLRDAYADVLRGLSIAEEVQDVSMRDITPQPPAPPSPPAPPQVSAKPDERPATEGGDQTTDKASETPSDSAVDGGDRQPPAPPSQAKKREQTIDADPFDEVAQKLESAMAKCGTREELKAVWKTAPDPKAITKEQDARLTEIMKRHKARIEEATATANDGVGGGETQDVTPFDLSEFRVSIVERLKEAKTADEVEDILGEVNGAHEAGVLSEAEKEQHFDDLFAEAFERMG